MSSLDPPEAAHPRLRQRTTRSTTVDDGSVVGHVDGHGEEHTSMRSSASPDSLVASTCASASSPSTSSAVQKHPLFERSKAFMVKGRPTTQLTEMETRAAMTWGMLHHADHVPAATLAPGSAHSAELGAREPRTPNDSVYDIKEDPPAHGHDHDHAQGEGGDNDDDLVYEYLTGRRSPIKNSGLTAVDPTASTPTPTPTLTPTRISTSNELKPTAETPPDPPSRPTAPVAEEEKVCRICFDGEDPDLGRLFSPCKCRGTSRHVHVSCLAVWRARSARASSFYQCDQCGYQYKFRRTAMASILSHRATLMSFTVIIFIWLVWIAGYGANFIIRLAESRRSQLSGSLFEDLWISDHVILGEGVREAVDFFGTKIETTQWAKEVLRTPLDHDGQAPPLKEIVGVLSGSVGKERYRIWFVQAVLHFFKGLSLVGLLSSFHSFIATSFLSPMGRGLFRLLRPATRNNNARNRPGQRDANGNLSQVVIVIFVIFGAAKAIAHTYHTVKWGAKKALSRVENLVLDV
ncbi:BQ2448_765 [Microbotryum intermedium]|uniref:BQ2448_765 protein n=1 Tax=Microbotryum intermedium TaxID=269621 RepID=A0A238F9U8_9BASI|nr:BQ2448_765 [Microbotryum intermedium]